MRVIHWVAACILLLTHLGCGSKSTAAGETLITCYPRAGTSVVLADSNMMRIATDTSTTGCVYAASGDGQRVAIQLGHLGSGGAISDVTTVAFALPGAPDANGFVRFDLVDGDESSAPAAAVTSDLASGTGWVRVTGADGTVRVSKAGTGTLLATAQTRSKTGSSAVKWLPDGSGYLFPDIRFAQVALAASGGGAPALGSAKLVAGISRITTTSPCGPVEPGPGAVCISFKSCTPGGNECDGCPGGQCSLALLHCCGIDGEPCSSGAGCCSGRCSNVNVCEPRIPVDCNGGGGSPDAAATSDAGGGGGGSACYISAGDSCICPIAGSLFGTLASCPTAYPYCCDDTNSSGRSGPATCTCYKTMLCDVNLGSKTVQSCP